MHPVDSAGPILALALALAFALTGGVDLMRWLRSTDDRSIDRHDRAMRALRRVVRS